MQRIKRPETLNMVVVPCNNDIATTEALKMAQEVDPEGTRTIGNVAVTVIIRQKSVTLVHF